MRSIHLRERGTNAKKASRGDGGEDPEEEDDVEQQQRMRDAEKLVCGIRNGKIVGGPADARRIRHATAPGNKPSHSMDVAQGAGALIGHAKR
eukprot:6199518-Pleurochrysis_carterae.AAC.3